MAIKILIGGSPCTHWSIAQKNNRETEPEGMGWELFKNYLIAKEKFKPDFFLYENNKSAAQAIKDQIATEFGVGVDPDVRFTYINSALVSAQNRQRFYVTNFGDIEQPEDRGILLKDILETGDTDREKGRAVIGSIGRTTTREYFDKQQGTMSFEPVAMNTTDDGDKARTLMAGYYKYGTATLLTNDGFKGGTTCIAEPINATIAGKSQTLKASPSSAVSSMFRKGTFGITGVAEPVYIGEIPEHKGKYRNGKQASQQYRVYSTNGKSVACDTDSRKYIPEPVTIDRAIPDIVEKYGYVPEMFNAYNRAEITDKSPTLSTGSMVTSSCATNRFESIYGYATACEWDENGKPTNAISCADGKTYTVYEVKDGQITIKGKQYPIKLADGYYIIRKLTVRECARLQTMPDDYCKAVSDSQAYKALGNGWTAEVIIHLLNHALKDVPRDEEIVVLSMYDGIATGRYCLDKMGFTNVTYHAYEIDKYPIQVAMDNYPDIIQHGDAFAVREDDWKAPQTRSEWLDELLGA